MPSACTKPDNKASNEAADPFKQVITVVDKKVRNLEKRKGKLEGYQDQRNKGKPLNQDQEEAVSRYETVIQNLEFAKELQKQFLSIQSEVTKPSNQAEKLLKKQMKREQHERQQHEIRRIKELLAVQNLLDSMGAEDVRADFAEGKSGALHLSEDNLKQLDELYKNISPVRDEEKNYGDQLNDAADHIVSFLDAREKEFAGTTYKDLKALVEKINECGYFEKKNGEEAEEATEEPEAPTSEAGEEDTEPQAPEEPAAQQEEEEPEEFVAAPVEEVVPAEEIPSQPIVEQQQPAAALDFGLGTDPVLLPPHQPGFEGQAAGGEEETFFNTANSYQQQRRPFNEIVNSVQGSFNFLQDSEIEAKAQAAAQQMDPAVVAAQMAPPPEPRPFLDDSGYANSPQTENPAGAGNGQFDLTSTPQTMPTHYPPAADQTAYAQSIMTQSLQNTAQQYESHHVAPPATFEQQQASFAQMAAAGAASGAAPGEAGPTPIPLPGQYEAAASHGAVEKDKKGGDGAGFANLNPNADIFQSMYTQASRTDSESTFQASTAPSQADKGFGDQNNAWSTSGGYDNNSQGYNGNYSGQQPRRGGQGSYRGQRGGQTNGYRGNRGNGAPRGNRGGSYGGGQRYQGYPGRSDYQPEGGYQGYNNGFNSAPGGRGGSRGGRGNRGGGQYGGQRAAQQQQQ